MLRWRYSTQLRWRLVTIGLAEDPERYLRAGYTPERMAAGFQVFGARFGMPFGSEAKARIAATSPACRAIVATRLRAPEHEWAAFRALQIAWFTTPVVLDEPEAIVRALGRVPGLDAAAIVGAIEDEDVRAAYERDRTLARSAEGGPTEAQGKSATSDGPVRFTAPSLVFELDGRRLEAGGFQPVEAYDVCLANLDPTLERRPAPEDPLDALRGERHGLTTQEVAAIMTAGNDAPDRPATEAALQALVDGGRATREPVGDDALWHVAA